MVATDSDRSQKSIAMPCFTQSPYRVGLSSSAASAGSPGSGAGESLQCGGLWNGWGRSVARWFIAPEMGRVAARRNCL
jgi:hypothetical protein